MDSFFFSGSFDSKLDDKNRFVLPQAMRYGLVENGKLEFTVGLGLGGCLAIYKHSDVLVLPEVEYLVVHVAKKEDEDEGEAREEEGDEEGRINTGILKAPAYSIQIDTGEAQAVEENCDEGL